MGQIKWYKRDPDAALSGMMGLTLEERGAYNTVLDLIYTRDGNLPDDDRFIAGWMGTDVRVWKRIKSRLMDLGKLFIEAGQLRNSRADVEVLSALSRVGSAREAGFASAQSRAAKSNKKPKKNNAGPATPVGTGASTGASTNHNHNQKEPNGSLPQVPHRDDDWPELPDWLPAESWNAWIEMRRRKRAWPTADAVKMAVKHLTEWRGRGHDPTDILDRSTLNNWTGIFEPKDNRNGSGNQPSRDNRDGFLRAIDGELGLGSNGGPARQAG